jgi:hypothetical protein
MKYLAFIIFLFFCSCNEKKAQSEMQTIAREITPGIDEIPEPGVVHIIPELNKKDLHPGKLILEAPFNADTAIVKLFPGHFEVSGDSDDTFRLVRWKCADCPREEVKELYLGDMTHIFPFESNATVIAEVRDIKWRSINYKLLLFYHSEFYIPEFMGRFIGAITGAAMFRETKAGYELKYFDEVLGMYGTYSQYNSPEIYEAPVPVIDFTYANGGAGDLYTGVKQLWIPHNGKFKTILTDRFISAGNSVVEWETEVKIENVISTGQNQFIIKLITSGYYEHDFSENHNYEWMLETAPPVFVKRMKKSTEEKKSFTFTLTRKYRFDNDYCILAGTYLDSKEKINSTASEPGSPSHK